MSIRLHLLVVHFFQLSLFHPHNISMNIAVQNREEELYQLSFIQGAHTM